MKPKVFIGTIELVISIGYKFMHKNYIRIYTFYKKFVIIKIDKNI